MTDLALKYPTTTDSLEHVIWISFWGNLGLAILKISMGILGYSRLLFADGLHSSANAVMSIILLIGLIGSERPKDTKHPYGHHNIQYMLSCLASLIILVAACFLLMFGIRSVRWISLTQPNIIVVLVVIISILGNELLFRYQTNASNEFDSVLLRSNALNNRINTFSSAVVLLSLLGAVIGFRQSEQLGIIIITIIIIWMCIRLLQKAFDGLMYKALPTEITDKIKLIVESVKGVKTISTIKTQLAGEKIYVDLVVGLDGSITTEDANVIAVMIREKLIQNLKKIEQVRLGFINI